MKTAYLSMKNITGDSADTKLRSKEMRSGKLIFVQYLVEEKSAPVFISYNNSRQMTAAGTLVLIGDMQERQWLSIPDLINPWRDVPLQITTEINQESRHGGGARASV